MNAHQIVGECATPTYLYMHVYHIGRVADDDDYVCAVTVLCACMSLPV